MKKEKARPYFYKTEKERKDVIRRSKTRYMLSKIWYCEVCDRAYCLAGKTQHLKTIKHNKYFLNRPLELDYLDQKMNRLRHSLICLILNFFYETI